MVRVSRNTTALHGERREPTPEWEDERAAPLPLNGARLALEALLAHATPTALAHLYSIVTQPRSIRLVDVLPSRLAEPARVRALGLLLAREAPRLEAVKFGLTLLAAVDGGDDRELLLELGRHEELTDTVASVLLRQSSEGERLVLQLAGRVRGWGRIHAVEQLAQTSDPVIRHWLLREGFRNTVMHEYSAFTCAMAGNLHEALAAPRVDTALLRGAAELLLALANGGPGPDLADYPFRNQAVAAWLRHLPDKQLDLHDLSALDALLECDELSAELRQAVAGLTTSPAVSSLIAQGLTGPAADAFERADLCAERRGIDTFLHCERRVASGDPRFGHALLRLLQQTDAPRLERALSAARSQLELGATSPESGLLLELVVSELQRFPGRGRDFVQMALESSCARTRQVAATTLEVWAASGVTALAPAERMPVIRDGETTRRFPGAG